jgi:hypothetical protein
MERMEYCQPHNTFHDYSIPCPYCAAEYENRVQDTSSHQTDTAAQWTVVLLAHMDCKHAEAEVSDMRDLIWTLEHR